MTEKTKPTFWWVLFLNNCLIQSELFSDFYEFAVFKLVAEDLKNLTKELEKKCVHLFDCIEHCAILLLLFIKVTLNMDKLYIIILKMSIVYSKIFHKKDKKERTPSKGVLSLKQLF